MSCEDCIHSEVCDMPIITDGRKNADNCGKFKNKADVVEVVRCKNCTKEGRFDCPLCYIEKKTLQFINHDPKFYCGYGERKDT